MTMVRRRQPLTAAACAGALALAGVACGGSGPGRPLAAPAAAALPTSASSHVAVIVMENKESSDVAHPSSSRYVTALAGRYASATASYAITHPSLPNYLALTSGSTNAITS